MNDKIRLDSIEEALEDIKNGKVIVVVDDEDRENEGDFILRRRNDNTGDCQLYGYTRTGFNLRAAGGGPLRGT